MLFGAQPGRVRRKPSPAQFFLTLANHIGRKMADARFVTGDFFGLAAGGNNLTITLRLRRRVQAKASGRRAHPAPASRVKTPWQACR